ncbi:MAG: O-antigen ligase family protein [Dehalococcoidia bacterium]
MRSAQWQPAFLPVPVRAVMALVFASFAAAAAALAPMAAVGLAAMAAFAWLVAAPAVQTLTVLLFLRGFTDGYSNAAVAFGLNPGSLLGLAIIAVAGARIALEPHPKGMLPSALLSLAVVVWTFVAYGRFGLDQSIIREVVRSTSLIAIGLVAVNHRGTLTPSRLATVVVIVAIGPVLFTLFEAASNWQALASDGFRTRGTLAHANSAAMFFSIAAVAAAWRGAFDNGGRRYILALGLFIVAIVTTKSMGGLGQVVVGLVLLGVMTRGGRRAGVAVSLVAVLLVVFFIVDPLGLSRFGEISQTNLSATQWSEANNSLDWRIVNTRAFLSEWWDASPLMGLGFGATADLVQPLGFQTHSEPLRVLVETGLLGALITAAALFAFVNKIVLRWRTSGGNAFYATMLAMLAGLAVHGLVTHVTETTAPMVLVVVYLAAGMTFHLDAPATEASTPEPSRPGAPHRSPLSTSTQYR